MPPPLQHFSTKYQVPGTPLLLWGNQNGYWERFQLFRGFYIHVNEAFKALVPKVQAQEVFAQCSAQRPGKKVATQQWYYVKLFIFMG